VAWDDPGGIRETARLRRRVQTGASDSSLTRFSSMVAVTELVDRVGTIELLDAAIGRIKPQDRGYTSSQPVNRVSVRAVGRGTSWLGRTATAPTPPIRRSRRCSVVLDGRWRAGSVRCTRGCSRCCRCGAPPHCAIRSRSTWTPLISRFTAGHKRAVAFSYQGQHCGRPKVASLAKTPTVSAADLMAGNAVPGYTPPSCWAGRSRHCPAPAQAGHDQGTHGRLLGDGMRGGQAMIATRRLRFDPRPVPARLIRHADEDCRRGKSTASALAGRRRIGARAATGSRSFGGGTPDRSRRCSR
jgi:hypothetical protein